MFRFVARFLLLALLLFGVYWGIESARRFTPVNELNAFLSSTLLNLVGVDNARDGTVVSFATGGMRVISECSGIYVVILFVAGVLAFPTTWRARLRGLFLGVPTILAINLLRLVTLGAIIAYREPLLPLFHEYLWQVFFVLVVATLYLLWIDRTVPRVRPRSTA